MDLRSRYLVLSIVTVMLTTTFAAAQTAESVAAETKRFQGVWSMIENEVNGVKAVDSQARTWLLVVEDNQYNPGSGETSVEYTFRIDPTMTPKSIDLIPHDGPHRGKVLRGVYAFEGDTLIVCRGLDADDDRPAGLTARAGSNRTRVVWKRRKG